MSTSVHGQAKRFSTVGLTQQERQHICDVFPAEINADGIIWSYTDEDDAAVLIVDTNDPDGRRLADTFVSRPGRVLIVMGDMPVNPTQGLYAFARPLTEDLIRRMLGTIISHFTMTGFRSSSFSVAAHAVGRDHSSQTRLIDVLRDLLTKDTDVQAFSISSREFPPLIVSPKAHKVIFGSSWEEFKHANLFAPVEVHDILDTNPNLPRLALDGEPLSHLLWLVGFRSGQGHLLPFVNPQQAFKLIRWPSLCTVELNNAFVKVMSYLSKHAATPATITDQTGISVGEVADLLNACVLCSYVEKVTTEQWAVPTKPTEASLEKRGLFNRIRHKLGMLQTGAAS